MRAAIVGAGPSGFYAADQLLSEGFAVDLFDTLPTPYGLVRAGVAPDHPKIKTVTRVYARTAARPGFRFFGGVTVGEAVRREDLLARYHVVVYAVGTPADRRLGIPGEDRPGSHGASEFVGWYNGHPEQARRMFDLAGARAVIVGNGNVAIDVARMLVMDPGELERTDIADHAIEALRGAGVQEALLLGRRGPAEAAFTNPELRELGELNGVAVVVDPRQLDGVGDPEDTTRRRNLELLRAYAQRPHDGARRIELRFLRSPVEILGDGDDGRVTGVRVVKNALIDGRAVATAETEVIECALVLRSIGYVGRPIAGVPFDGERGLIRNRGGRVCDRDGAAHPGEYVVGWAKRGPSGVIGTNKKDAADTVARIVEDRASLAAPARDADPGWPAERVPELVRWSGWESIDRHETERGAPDGRPRVKLVHVGDMHDVARGPQLAR